MWTWPFFKICIHHQYKKAEIIPIQYGGETGMERRVLAPGSACSTGTQACDWFWRVGASRPSIARCHPRPSRVCQAPWSMVLHPNTGNSRSIHPPRMCNQLAPRFRPSAAPQSEVWPCACPNRQQLPVSCSGDAERPAPRQARNRARVPVLCNPSIHWPGPVAVDPATCFPCRLPQVLDRGGTRRLVLAVDPTALQERLGSRKVSSINGGKVADSISHSATRRILDVGVAKNAGTARALRPELFRTVRAVTTLPPMSKAGMLQRKMRESQTIGVPEFPRRAEFCLE